MSHVYQGAKGNADDQGLFFLAIIEKCMLAVDGHFRGAVSRRLMLPKDPPAAKPCVKTDAYLAGCEAAARGIHENPHPLDSAEAAEWAQGYRSS